MRTILLSCAAIALLPASLALSAVDVAGTRMSIETDHGRIVIDRGVITGMTNKLTGETYTATQAGAKLTGLLWHGRKELIDPDTQVSVDRTKGNGTTVSASLPQSGKVSTAVAIDSATQDILIRQAGSSSRKGLYAVQWGIAGIDVNAVNCLVPGMSGVRLGADCPMQSLGFTWPTGWEVQMMVVQGEKGGFWIWSQDEQMHFKALRWNRSRDTVRLAFESHSFAPFDERTSVESVEWRLAFFEGDWRGPAKRYRDWAEKAWALTPLKEQRPAWVSRIRFMATVGMDTAMLDELRKHVPPEATLLYVPNWRKYRYDVMYPDYEANEKFKPFVDYAHRLGYRVMPHMNYFGCDPKHEAYERFEKYHLRNPFSKEHVWWIPPLQRNRDDIEPSTKFAYINPASKEWRAELTRRLAEAHEKYGFDAIHLDQTLCIINDPAGPIDGLTCAEGSIALHRQLREAMPEVALSGEGLDEITCRHEAFAQRHASHAVNHVFGTWNDAFIRCGHPISSYFLLPYTTINGYLGLCNPSNRGLFLGWRRAYENWGVIPTFSRPYAAQFKRMDGEVASLLAEAKVWAADQLEPDFEAKWEPGTKFRLRGNGGTVARYECGDGDGSRFVRLAKGRRETVYEVIRGVNEHNGTGSVPAWCAYNEDGLFGLDPRQAYSYVGQLPDHSAPHLLSASGKMIVGTPMMDENKAMFELRDVPAANTFDFIDRVTEAETGIVVDGKVGALDHGGSFIPTMDRCGLVHKRALFAHPPWRVRVKGKAPAKTFGRFSVAIPAGHQAVLELAVGLRDAVDGRSDGVQFRVEVNGEAVFDEFWTKSEWKDVSVPLDKWAGKTVSVALITTPGPDHNPSFDWACWGEPRIRFTAGPKPTEIVFVSPRPADMIVSSDPGMTWQPASPYRGLHAYRARLNMPARIAFITGKPRPVQLPLDLAKTPFGISVAINNAPAQLPILYVGAGPGSGTSTAIARQGLCAHPPSQGRTSMDFLLQLPDREPITLEFAPGVRDDSRTTGVIFIVEANTKELYRLKLTQPDGWHPAKVDLSEFAGKTLLLSLVVDADGPYSFDWATWADPTIR